MVVAIRDGLVARIQFAPIQALGEPLRVREGHESKRISAREVGWVQMIRFPADETPPLR